jgi:hypothetical protein
MAQERRESGEQKERVNRTIKVVALEVVHATQLRITAIEIPERRQFLGCCVAIV